MEVFNIGRVLFSPGRKVYGILVESKLNAEILKEISDLGFRHCVITPTIQYNLVDDGKVVGLGFVDLTDATVSIEEFVEKMCKIKGVIGVQIVYPTAEGFVADNLSVRLLVAGERAVIFRRPGYEGLFGEIRKQFGTAGEAFLYYTGYEAGIKYGKDHQKIADKLGIKDSIQIMRKITAPLSQSMGWGKTEIVEAKANPPRIILKLYECFECELGAGNKKPYSHFIRGTLAGFSAQLFNRKMEAKESQCIAKGDSHCKFTITPSK